MTDDERMAIRTPEHVELQFLLAGAGNRFLAVLVDLVLQGVLLLAMLLGLLAAFWAAPQFFEDLAEGARRDLGVWAVAGLILAFFVVQWGYFTFFETLWAGQTPGKRLVKIRVIREDGRPIGFTEAAIRNLLRAALDAQPFNMYVIGFVTGMLNARFKRLGDFAAGTVVIRERREAVPAAGPRLRVPPQAVLPQAAPRVRQLTREEAATLQAFLRRRDELESVTRAEMARRIAVSLMERLEIVRPVDMGYEAFLDWLDQELRKTQAFR